MTQELELRVAQGFMLVNNKMSRATAELANFKNGVGNAIQRLGTQVEKRTSPGQQSEQLERKNIPDQAPTNGQKNPAKTTEKTQAQGGYPPP